MNKLISLECNSSNALECSQRLVNEIEKNRWVELLPHSGDRVQIPEHLLPKGPGIIISSGGSTGKSHQCLQPCENLKQSALATAILLNEEGINPKDCFIFNSLPLNHVSGLMGWWRSEDWNAKHQWLHPELMRNPPELERFCEPFLTKNKYHFITSLVPTQLKRLLNHPSGIRWLQSMTLIWIGGAPLSEELATIARKKEIPLAPCYGSSETMAMVTALMPSDFLKGEANCGCPLMDVEIRVKANNILEIRTPRLAIAIWDEKSLNVLKQKEGWWSSSDLAELTPKKDGRSRLKINGRVDTAIHSGGETIFPERIQERLIQSAKTAHIPIQLILVLPVSDAEWGERIVVLVRLQKYLKKERVKKIFLDLNDLTKSWNKAEKPFSWYQCEELSMNKNGKWENKKWGLWLKGQKPIL